MVPPNQPTKGRGEPSANPSAPGSLARPSLSRWYRTSPLTGLAPSLIRAVSRDRGGALHQQLAHQPPAAGPQGGTDGQLAPAGHRPGQLEAGDIRASDEQHQPDGAQEDEQRSLLRRHPLVMERADHEGAAGGV